MTPDRVPHPFSIKALLFYFEYNAIDRSNQVFIRYQISSYIIRFIIIYVPRLRSSPRTTLSINGKRKTFPSTPCSRTRHRHNIRNIRWRKLCIFLDNDTGIHAVYQLERVQLYDCSQYIHTLCLSNSYRLCLAHQIVTLS